ncbi:MAG: hypothetical protein HC933_15035 [Pleurocapsa sp. SU_196_0]|nr:hypothetical protein [Pleurocapsa sp. SU_196_0]
MPDLSQPWKIYRQSGQRRLLKDSYATEEAAVECASFMNRQLSRHQDLDRVRYVVVFEPSSSEFTASGLLPPGND